MFGANLRTLAESYPSISELSRQLRINRTQFNRYLSGESFPRPDVLARICDFFSVDARVLLEPVGQFGKTEGPAETAYLGAFMGPSELRVPPEYFPSGFYAFSRASFVDKSLFVRGLVFVSRDGQNTFLRGFEPKSGMALQGMPTHSRGREFRGFIMQLEDGVSATVSRVGGLTASFNYLSRVPSYDNNFWLGYVARTVREETNASRVTRLVYEHLGRDTSKVLKAARSTGFCDLNDLPPFHRRLLQPDTPFR
jgi:transcriptional regulator with XRE-family HTH domain